jgi:ferredoxin
MTTHTIAFANGPTFVCAPDCAVSMAMRRAGVRANPPQCRGGGCGVCRVRVVAGDYHTRRMSREHVSEADEAAGYALGCCLYPDSDLVLEVATKPG